MTSAYHNIRYDISHIKIHIPSNGFQTLRAIKTYLYANGFSLVIAMDPFSTSTTRTPD